MIGYFRLNATGSEPKSPVARRRFVLVAGVVLAVASTIMSIGCNSNSTFLPPPPEGLRGDGSEEVIDVPAPPGLEGVSAGASSVEMILDRRDSTEVDGLLAQTRTQAGIDKVKLRTKILGEKETPAQQVELVREAIARKPLALIVELADPTDTRMSDALQKARADGIPVVFINRLPSTSASTPGVTKATGTGSPEAAASTNAASQRPQESSGVRPFVLVTPTSFTEPARRLVISAIRNAKNARLDPKGGAVIVVNSAGDPFIHDRTVAIRNALKEKGITTIEEVVFSKSAEVGSKLLKEKLLANSKLVLVFAIDGLSTAALRPVLTELNPDRPYVQATFASEGKYTDMIRAGDYAAVAGYIPNRVIRKAITTAVNLSQGRDVASRVEVPVELFDSDEKSALPQSPTYLRKTAAEKSAH